MARPKLTVQAPSNQGQPRNRPAPRPGTTNYVQGHVITPRPGTLEVKGQWIGSWRGTGPDLNELDDEDKLTGRYAGMDAWTVKDGEIVDLDPVTTGGADLRAYQTMIANGYDDRL